jgi:hypothetical protein
MKEIAVDGAVRAFIGALSASWTAVSQLASECGNPSLIDDWMQANWEMIVEASLPHDWILEPYGDGADCYGSSSRVSRADAVPNAAVFCVSADASVLDLLSGKGRILHHEGEIVDRFVAIVDGWYANEQPFDGVLVDSGDDDPRLYKLQQVRFVARKTG